jgi:hypothetical protein
VPSYDDHARHDGAHHHSPLVTSAHATLHCLIGCMIGEATGLAIGVALGWGVVATITLAVVLAYISGFAMALVPVMKQAGLSLAAAMRVIWLGEAISIAVMEIAMNGVDYWVGGIQVASIWSALFWLGLAAAGLAGFLAAWPVNHLLLKHELKAGH